jgi:hypothetical protein
MNGFSDVFQIEVVNSSFRAVVNVTFNEKELRGCFVHVKVALTLHGVIDNFIIVSFRDAKGIDAKKVVFQVWLTIGATGKSEHYRLVFYKSYERTAVSQTREHNLRIARGEPAY